TYTALVTNNGPSAATNVLLVDSLPISLTYRSASSSQGSCGGATTVMCNLGAMSNGGTATVIIAATTNVTGVIANTLGLASDTNDPNTSNNTQLVTATVTSIPQPSADLSPSVSGVPSAI
ncbi:MAG: DUF11 domain-containing protein, partial [Chloroflexi bacterium]|nr:DUF11 domain-containing protein [Chloroflexota bacterium]